MATKVGVDCSFLAHALIPSQQTPIARAALNEANLIGHELLGAAVLFSEFPSVLRKLVTRQSLSKPEAQALFEIFRQLPIESTNASRALMQRSWDLSIALDQSDTHDSMGYAVAEMHKAEFWTSDQRFTNAAANKGLRGYRLFA
ncbi:MAG: type II toxin-antitoxin system VapC family toxin [Tepidiformaceae bacterium]